MKKSIAHIAEAKREMRKAVDRDEISIPDKVLLIDCCAMMQAMIERNEKR